MSIQLPKESCTGCGACMNTCGVGAIRMQTGEDGFAYPVISAEACVQCGQCLKACHAAENTPLRASIRCYAAQLQTKDVLKISTSGGLFYALARYVLSTGGAVYGCVYDENYRARISRTDTLDGLQAMHGSKYVWSDPAQSYTDVKKELEQGKTVLYTGLPCQIAGLKAFLRKDYPTLYTVDVLCGGAPSPYAFERYLETLTERKNWKELNFQFRDKENYGAGVHCSYLVNGVKHHENYLENSFYFAFSSKSRITWRTSCYRCGYKSIRRASDLTIGDYWGVENHHKAFRPKDGVSLVLVNTEQGQRLFEAVKDDLRWEESQVSCAMEKNSLVKENEEGYVPVPSAREAFFRTLRAEGWKAADKKYLGLRRWLLLRQKAAKIPRKLLRNLKG